MKNKLDVLLDEQKFPCIGMDKEERNLYLTIIKNCKDICDTEQKIDDQSNCNLIEMTLRKEGNEIKSSGSVFIGTDDKKEYRTIEVNLYIEKDVVIVDMLVTRLKPQDKNKIYRILDEFYVDDNILTRRSQYNYNMKSTVEKINNDDAISIIKFISNQKMKGRRK